MTEFEGSNLRLPKSLYFYFSVIFTIVSSVVIILTYFTPYWLESYETSCSDFVKLGLWNVCFKKYKHPSYHTDQVFDGCNWILSYKYQDIGWLQPGWFILTQVLMTSGLVFSVTSSIFVGLLLTNYVKPFKVFMLALTFVLTALSALTVFLAVCVFGSMCFDRAWIQHPNYNHLSWSYGLAIIGFIIEGCASGLLLAEAFRHSRHMRFEGVAYFMPNNEDRI